MNKIVTISREFGSGGRELGKRLSDALGVPCYDNEIIEMITKEHGFDADYVAQISESGLKASYPLTIGRRFSTSYTGLEQQVQVVVAQRKIIERLGEQGDCVIVGRCADVILAHLKPLRVFVYASQASKLDRCRKRAAESERLTPLEMERRMRRIDKNRAEQYDLVGGADWGARGSYDLCVNTSGKEIKTLIPALAEYARCWFGESGGGI